MISISLVIFVEPSEGVIVNKIVFTLRENYSDVTGTGVVI